RDRGSIFPASSCTTHECSFVRAPVIRYNQTLDDRSKVALEHNYRVSPSPAARALTSIQPSNPFGQTGRGPAQIHWKRPTDHVLPPSPQRHRSLTIPRSAASRQAPPPKGSSFASG